MNEYNALRSDGMIYRSLGDGQSWEQTEYEGDGFTTYAEWPNGDVVLASLGSVF